MSKNHSITMRILSIITLVAFIATQCGLGYAYNSSASSKLRQMQKAEHVAFAAGAQVEAKAAGEWVEIDIGNGQTIKINNAGEIFTKKNYYIDLLARTIPDIVGRLTRNGNKLEMVCELFAGRGVLTVGFAKYLPGSKIIGVDIQQEAVDRIRENAQANNVVGRVSAVKADAFEFLQNAGQFDLIVCDAPFIPRDMNRFSDEQIEQQRERHPDFTSIFKGNTADGRYYIDRLITEAAVKNLRPGGAIIFTQGDFTNIEKTEYMMRQYGLEPLDITGREIKGFIIGSETKPLASARLTQSLKDYIEGLNTGIEGVKPYHFMPDASGELVFQALVVGGVKAAAAGREPFAKPAASLGFMAGVFIAVVIDADSISRNQLVEQIESGRQFDEVISAVDEDIAQKLIMKLEAKYHGAEVRFVKIQKTGNVLILSADGLKPKTLDPQADVNTAINAYLQDL